MKLCGCDRPSVARWLFPDGVGGTLCQRHLDMWLDNGDDDPVEEPADLIWL